MSLSERRNNSKSGQSANIDSFVEHVANKWTENKESPNSIKQIVALEQVKNLGVKLAFGDFFRRCFELFTFVGPNESIPKAILSRWNNFDRANRLPLNAWTFFVRHIVSYILENEAEEEGWRKRFEEWFETINDLRCHWIWNNLVASFVWVITQNPFVEADLIGNRVGVFQIGASEKKRYRARLRLQTLKYQKERKLLKCDAVFLTYKEGSERPYFEFDPIADPSKHSIVLIFQLEIAKVFNRTDAGLNSVSSLVTELKIQSADCVVIRYQENQTKKVGSADIAIRCVNLTPWYRSVLDVAFGGVEFPYGTLDPANVQCLTAKNVEAWERNWKSRAYVIPSEYMNMSIALDSGPRLIPEILKPQSINANQQSSSSNDS